MSWNFSQTWMGKVWAGSCWNPKSLTRSTQALGGHPALPPGPTGLAELSDLLVPVEAVGDVQRG